MSDSILLQVHGLHILLSGLRPKHIGRVQFFSRFMVYIFFSQISDLSMDVGSILLQFHGLPILLSDLGPKRTGRVQSFSGFMVYLFISQISELNIQVRFNSSLGSCFIYSSLRSLTKTYRSGSILLWVHGLPILLSDLRPNHTGRVQSFSGFMI